MLEEDGLSEVLDEAGVSCMDEVAPLADEPPPPPAPLALPLALLALPLVLVELLVVPSLFWCTTSCGKLGSWKICPLAVMKLIGCWLFCDNKLTGMLMICEAPVDDGSRNCCILCGQYWCVSLIQRQVLLGLLKRWRTFQRQGSEIGRCMEYECVCVCMFG